MSNIVRIGDKFYDFGTKNRSFLQTAQELKTIGIKNWYFMLEVKYPQLGVQDIDPYDPAISKEDIGRVIIECKNNIWYFMREVAKIPAKGAPKPYDLCLTRASCAATWCYDHNIDFMLCQPRQTWKTTQIMLLCTYAFVFDLKNVDIPFMHIKEKDTLRNAGMFRDYVCELPSYMNPWYGRQKLPGLKSLKYDEHGTDISILSSADSDVKAKDKMRGMTLFVVSIDEYEYIPYIDSVIAGATPAMISGRNIARETGGRTCVMLSSTPGDLETQPGKAAQRMIDMTPRFSEQMYDLTEEELSAMFEGMVTEGEDGEKNPVTMVYIEFNYKQLRKTEKWLREQYNEAKRTNKLDEYRRGVLLQRYRGSGSVLFEKKDLDYMVEHQREPDHDIFLLKKFHLYTYNHQIIMSDMISETPYFDITIPYLIGVDVAAGGDGDNTALCIVHPYTLEIVGELISPYIGVFDLMRIITEVAKLCPKGVFCVETNSIGKAIVDFIQETQLEHRFYHDPKLDISKNAITKETPEMTVKRKAIEKGYIGTYVTASIRNHMFDLLKTHVRDYKHLLVSKYLVKDIVNLIRSKTGKIEAAEGFHDDMVMAYNHVLYVHYYGYKLERFGIDKTQCTFQKALKVISDYEDSLNEDLVNNMIPYENPDAFENIMLRDITSKDPMHFMGQSNQDEYGYRRQDYRDYGTSHYQQSEEPEFTVTSADLAFLHEVNQFY